MQIVMYSQFWNAMMLWTIATHDLSCQWHTYKLYNWTVHFESNSYYNVRSTSAIALFKVFLQGFSYSMYIILNICICFDLVKSIRDPFSQTEKRERFYILISYTVSFFCAILFTVLDKAGSYIYLIFLITFLLVSSGSLIFCWIRLRNSSLSK